MKKHWLLFIVLMLALIPAIALASAPPVYTEAQIVSRLDDLAETLHMKYFTTTGEACNGTTHTSGHGCAKCALRNVVAESSAFRTTSGLSKWPSVPSSFSVNHGIWSSSYNSANLYDTNYSCRAFANFAGWYLFSSTDTDKVRYHRLLECSLKDVHNYARPGDIIATGNHSMIYISGSASSLTVLDCNAEYGNYGQCLIRRRARTADSSSATISRADNYALRTDYTLLADDAIGDHEYRLYSGYCSWEEANAFASSLGAGWHLATITGAEEQSLIAGLVSKWNGYKYGGMAWLGGRYSNGSWGWVTGEPFEYANWQATPSSPSSKPYLSISGWTNTKDEYNTVQNKWKEMSSLYRFFMTGFVVEYTPTIETFEGAVYDFNATMTVVADEASLYSWASTNSNFLRALPHGETVQTENLLISDDGEMWCRLDTGAYVSCHALRYVSSGGSVSSRDLLIPAALQPYGAPFTYCGTVHSTNDICAVVVRLDIESSGNAITEFWYPSDDTDRQAISLGDIADDMTLMDLSAYDPGNYTLSLYFLNALENLEYTISTTFIVSDQTCSHRSAFPHVLRSPTCTQDGLLADYCSICQRILDYRETVPATGHTAGSWVVAQEPTASAHGSEELRCAVCGAAMQTRVLPGAGYTFLNRKTDPATGHEYILMSGSTSWTNARNYAAALGSDYGLACMDGDSANEQQIIQSLVTELGKACWLGGSCTGGSWMWLSGKPISTDDARWASGQPSGTYGSSSEQYLGIYGDSAQTSYAEINKWNDFSLSSGTIKGFVIERAPNAVYCPPHLTLLVGDSYELLTGTRNVDDLFVSSGAENVFIYSDGDTLMLDAEKPGYALLEFIGTDGSSAYMGITILAAPLQFTIVPEGDDWDGVLYAGSDRTFRLDVQGIDMSYVSAPVWSLSGDAAMISSTDNFTCTLSTASSGAVTLSVSVEAWLEDGYLNPSKAFTAELSIATLVPDASDITCVIPEGSPEAQLDYLRGIFLDGWYSALYDTVPEGEVQYRIHVGDHTLGVSSIACDHTACNAYWGYMKGTKALGYARILYNLLWDQELARDSYMFTYNPDQNDFYFLENVTPGDCIYTGSHYMIVTQVVGDTVYVTDCNSDGKCILRWDAAFTFDELKEIIRANGKGRCYTPAFKPIFSSAMTEYTVCAGKSVTVYSHPFNDSRHLTTLSEGTIFAVDSSHTYENTNASYGAGTWALAYPDDGNRGWVYVEDTASCREVDLGERFVVHADVTTPTGVYDLEAFRTELLNRDYRSIFTGLVSGVLEDASVTIRPINPVTGETQEAVAQWSSTFIPGFRSTIDFTGDAVRFSDEDLYRLSEGAYQCEIEIRYIEDDVVYEWDQSSAVTTFWLVTPETAFPADCEPEYFTCDTVTSVDIPVFLGNEPFTLLYPGIEMLSGEDVGSVSWSWSEDEFFLHVEKLQTGTVSFELQIADGYEGSCWWSVITVNFLPCQHESDYVRTGSCLEEAYWYTQCTICGEILADGYEKLNDHAWRVASCTPAGDADGHLGAVVCMDCDEVLYAEQVIPADRVLKLPAGLSVVGEEAFRGTDAMQIIVPYGAVTIEESAFAGCDSLLLLVLPDTLEDIPLSILGGRKVVIYDENDSAEILDWAQGYNLPFFRVE